MKVLIAGGGTGGHINPALAIASIIKSYDSGAQFLFVGTPFGMEARLIPEAGYNMEFIKVSGIQRKLTPKNIARNAKAVFYLASAGRRAAAIINGFKPDIAIGTGGYVSGPVISKAAKMGIPTAIHEANAYPGMTTRLLSKEVDIVMLTTDAAADYLGNNVKYVITGLPVRNEIKKITRDEARRALGLDFSNNEMCILSFGGSLGAGCINEVAAEVIRWHTKNNLRINHIHGYGGMGRESFPKAMKEMGLDMKTSRLRVTEYINDMDKCLAAADLVICRAGASTLAELQSAGRASILIPSPVVAGNHQLHNANVLGRAGAAVVIEQKDVTADLIIGHINELYNNRSKLFTMAQNAASLAVRDTNERIFKAISQAMSK